MLNSPIKKAVIPVAGIGTRMLPATKAQRKEMLPVAGKPLIQYSVEEAAASGIETVILVTGAHSAPLLAHFARDIALEQLLEKQGKFKEADRTRLLSQLVTFCTVNQTAPLGLGHSVYCARELVGNEPFVLLLPDVIIDGAQPCTAQLRDAYYECGGNVIATRRLHRSELRRHGVVAPAGSIGDDLRPFRITALVEKPALENAPSDLGVFGRYLLQPAIFEYIERLLRIAAGEIQLTDALNLMAKEQAVYGLQFTGEHFDAGEPVGFLKANIALSLKDPELGSELRTFLQSLCATEPRSNSR
jgi:UTP--glucose-1-phosphate uridylyltransferase